MSVSTLERLTEYVDSRGASLRVDKSSAVICGVKVLGSRLKNGRRYPPAVIEKAASKYEGVSVNVDHSTKPSELRSYASRFGRLQNVRATSDGLFADLHYNPKHAIASQFEWDAEHSPSSVGLSHVINATAQRHGGFTEIESIDSVESVDLVADPATTSGLFESHTSPVITDSKSFARYVTESGPSESELSDFVKQFTE